MNYDKNQEMGTASIKITATSVIATTTIGGMAMLINMASPIEQPSHEVPKLPYINLNLKDISYNNQNSTNDTSFPTKYPTTIESEKFLKLNEVLHEIELFDDPLQKLKKIFLKEIVEGFISSENTLIDNDTSEESLAYTLKFILDMPVDYKIPEYDIHPDGEFSLIWYGKNESILSTAFSKDGLLSYAYLSLKDNERNKGNFPLKKISFNENETTSESAKVLKLFIQKLSA